MKVAGRQMNTDRLEKEQVFHDSVFEGDDNEGATLGKQYSVNRQVNQCYVDIVSEHCKGKRLLEYGCGTARRSKQWLGLGATYTGIDISPEGIKRARKRTENAPYDAHYFVMNAESTEFHNSSFDIVVGTGILHHLNLSNAYQELSRILEADGHAVFVEPLGHNPLINLYRALTPRARTENEHPLKVRDLKLLEQYFCHVKAEYFTLFTLLAVPFTNMFFFHALCGFLRSIDKMVFLLPLARRYAWITVVHASHPRK